MGKRNVLEYAASVTPHRVDRERGIIHDVKVLGMKSKNGPSYSPEAVRNAAKLYAGIQTFIGHPDRLRPDAERSPQDLFGWLENPRAASDGIRADLHYLKTHPMACQIAEVAERRPDKLGLSHNAVVAESMHGSEVVYESIERVRSVDIVCRPATSRGIFESLDETMAPEPGRQRTKGEMWANDNILAKAREILDGDGTPAEKHKAIIRWIQVYLGQAEAVDRAMRIGTDPASLPPEPQPVVESVRETVADRQRKRNRLFDDAFVLLGVGRRTGVHGVDVRESATAGPMTRDRQFAAEFHQLGIGPGTDVLESVSNPTRKEQAFAAAFEQLKR